VDVSLLSLSWWIALCACRETPGGILELSWPLKHLKRQFAVPVGLLCAVFSNSLYHDCVQWTATSAGTLIPCQRLPLTGFVDLPLPPPCLPTHFRPLLHVLVPISNVQNCPYFPQWWLQVLPQIFQPILSPWSAGPSTSCFDACLESECILTAIAESVNFSDTSPLLVKLSSVLTVLQKEVCGMTGMNVVDRLFVLIDWLIDWLIVKLFGCLQGWKKMMI